MKVFPATILADGKKVPLINEWETRATDDPAQIKAWQDQFRDRLKLWGAPCAPNGFFALDIDVKNEGNGFETLAKHGIQIPETVWQRTPTGGLHLLFQYDPNLNLRNTVDREKGIDTRASGGWIGLYNLDLSKPLLPIPDWVHSLVRKPINQIDPSQLNTYQLSPQVAFGRFTEAIRQLRNAQPGERNQTLNTVSYIIGQLVAAGAVSYEHAFAELTAAAQSIGLEPYEIQATSLSGLKGGAAHPLSHPFGSTPPVPVIPIIPPMPQAPEQTRWTPRFATMRDLLDVSKLKKPQLFEHWSTEDIHLTSAIGGVGKTTLKLFEAICLATGEPFLGFKCLSPGRTLFIIGEDSEEKLYAMMGRICKQLGYFEPQNEGKLNAVLNNVVIKLATDLSLVSQDPRTKMLSPNPDAIAKLAEAIEDLQPRQIVFDPIAMFWGRESDGNDMAMALAKAMQAIQRISGASVDMISHIGKDSHTKKDTSQFSARGATALANHSRVIRTLLKLNENEYTELMGEELQEGSTAIQVFVSKFSDGSPILDKPFLIVRKGYLFERREILNTNQGTMVSEKNRIVQFLRANSTESKPVTEKVLINHFFIQDPKITKSNCRAALQMLEFEGVVRREDHPDTTVGEWLKLV